MGANPLKICNETFQKCMGAYPLADGGFRLIVGGGGDMDMSAEKAVELGTYLINHAYPATTNHRSEERVRVNGRAISSLIKQDISGTNP